MKRSAAGGSTKRRRVSCRWKADKRFRHDEVDEWAYCSEIGAGLLRVYRIEKIYVSDAISERERAATHEVIMKKTY